MRSVAERRPAAAFVSSLGDESERDRFDETVDTLRRWADVVRGQVLDFGASWGTSMVAARLAGADSVVGVEPDRERVQQGQGHLAELGLEGLDFLWVKDTTALPFASGTFDLVFANAVFEHIPPPRAPYLKEAWRVLDEGGHLLMLETPNKYLPIDLHTTGLWWVPWLPERLARRYAEWRDAHPPGDVPWEVSGWRGVGYFEVVAALDGCEPVFRSTRLRHRVLDSIGLPPVLVDPYPEMAFKKVS